MTIEAPETRIVNTWRVACDGGEGGLGHPRVWLQIPRDQGWIECGYCDCRFVHADAESTNLAHAGGPKKGPDGPGRPVGHNAGPETDPNAD